MHESTTTTYQILLEFLLRSKHQWAAIAERYGLSLPQLHAVSLLMHREAMPMVQLSTLLACDASYVTGIVDRLEEQGIVERRENPADRRVKMIGLTQKGRNLRDTVHHVMSESQSTLFGRLTKTEQEEFTRLLHKMISPEAYSGKNFGTA